jgi:DNA gyrase subunit A
VRGIRLPDDDTVVSLNLTPKDSQLLVVTEHGYGKRTPIDEYPVQSRGGGGVITLKVTEKTGAVAAARVISDHDNDLMLISASGIVIRTDVSTVRIAGRATQGVMLMNLSSSDSVVAVATTNGKKLDTPNGNENENGTSSDETEEVVDIPDENGQEESVEQ